MRAMKIQEPDRHEWPYFLPQTRAVYFLYMCISIIVIEIKMIASVFWRKTLVKYLVTHVRTISYKTTY